MRNGNIRFVYDEPALIAKSGKKDYLVVADLHIGMEIGLSRKGIHLFDVTDGMAARIKRIIGEFSINDIVILGDVKDAILYPEKAEINLLKQFFKSLEGFNTVVVAGNHDAHLGNIIDCNIVKELVIGDFGFIHGNSKPDSAMMRLDYIISAHDHVAVRIVQESGAIYEQKAWAVYNLDRKEAKSEYSSFNDDIKLVSMPAFNDLIMGTAIDASKKRINPLLRNGIFDNRSVELYSMGGQRIG
ncbi:MAG: metallophosphoesterase [Candidatus Micrarchaeaceae archaeon]